MSRDTVLEIEVSQSEAGFIINAMEECKYKDVRSPIEQLKRQLENTFSDNLLLVALTLDQAQKTLNIVLDRPFREVYQLVGKINDQIKLKTSNTQMEEVEQKETIVDARNCVIETSHKRSPALMEEHGGGQTLADNPETIGRPLAEEVLGRLTANENYLKEFSDGRG